MLMAQGDYIIDLQRHQYIASIHDRGSSSTDLPVFEFQGMSKFRTNVITHGGRLHNQGSDEACSDNTAPWADQSAEILTGYIL